MRLQPGRRRLGLLWGPAAAAAAHLYVRRLADEMFTLRRPVLVYRFTDAGPETGLPVYPNNFRIFQHPSHGCTAQVRRVFELKCVF